MISCAQRSVRWMLFLCALTLNGCFSAYPLNASSSSAERERAEQAILQSAAILSAKEVDLRQRSLALASYRSAVLKLLPILKNDSVASQRKHQKGFFNPRDLSEITPIGRSRVTVSGLHRDGLGLSVIGRIAQSGVTDPNAPGSGFVAPATVFMAFRRTRSSFKLSTGSGRMCQSNRLSEIAGGATTQTVPMASCPIRARTWISRSRNS
jgi:hypothetical protein